MSTSTKNRLKELEIELSNLKETRNILKAKWESEKGKLQEIRALKEEIDALKTEADRYEREGNLDKVAEIRYGKIHQLELKITKANEELEELQKNSHLLKEQVTEEDIAEIVSKWTGIPVSKMIESEKQKLLKMEDLLHERVVGQEEAVSAVSNAIRRSRAGLQDENRPIGSFIFIGTTGVGKTELAKALAEYLFDDENAIIRLDMSEYMDKFSVTRLIGAPPGYVGYDEGGQLTENVRRKQYSVILLDEIEKAHPDVFNILLQVLDDGRLTDSKGRTVNFKNTIIIMTSNLGTEYLTSKMGEMNSDNRETLLAEAREQIVGKMKQVMRPEFLNRIDEVVMFKPLLKEEVANIAKLQFNILAERLSKQNLKLEITDEALKWLAEISYDVNYGARPIKRTIQKKITDPLSMNVLSGEIKENGTIIVDTDGDGKFIFKIENN